MLVAPLPPDEHARLDALYALRLLDTPAEERFDTITQLAAHLFEVPIAFVSLVDRERQWMKSRVGLAVCETSRERSFCSHAILSDGALVVPDTFLDSRFADNPLVTGDPFLRFYAGQPLRASGGEKIGTLCIADQRPHDFPESQVEILRQLGSLVERELRTGDLIDLQTSLLATQRELLNTRRHLQAELSAAAKYLVSLLPLPIREPLAIDWRLLSSDELGGDGLGFHDAGDGKVALYILDVCGHGVGAAMLSVAILSLLRSQSLPGVDFSDPAAVLTALNREFPMERHGRFFTFWYGVFDVPRGKIVYSSGGHPPPILFGRDGTHRRLSTDGIAVGCVGYAKYQNAEQSFGPGDILYLFSDGAYELRIGRGKPLVLDEFEAVLSRAAQKSSSSLDFVLQELMGISGSSRFSDDVTLMEVRVPGSSL